MSNSQQMSTHKEQSHQWTEWRG